MMTDQQSLFDLDAARAAGQAGRDQAEGADRVQTWADRARITLNWLAESGRPFTADDLVMRVGLPDEGVNRNNAIGAIINGAARRKLITKVGYRQSSRVLGHGRTVAVWRGAWTVES